MVFIDQDGMRESEERVGSTPGHLDDPTFSSRDEKEEESKDEDGDKPLLILLHPWYRLQAGEHSYPPFYILGLVLDWRNLMRGT